MKIYNLRNYIAISTKSRDAGILMKSCVLLLL